MADARSAGSSSSVLFASAAIAILALGGWWLLSDDAAPSDLGQRTEAPLADSGDGGDVEGEQPENAESDLTRRAVKKTTASGPAGAQASGVADDGASIAASRPSHDRFAFVIRGTVVDPSGIPLEGVRLHVPDQTLESLSIPIGGLSDLVEMDFGEGTPGGNQTGEDGTFEIGVPEAGNYRLVASHSERPRVVTKGSSSEGEDIEGLQVTMRQGATISGSLVGMPAPDPTDEDLVLVAVARRIKGALETVGIGSFVDLGSMMEGFGISANDRLVVLSGDGRFEIPGLDPDADYLVWCAQSESADIREIRFGRPPSRCTKPVNVHAGAAGLQLAWQEGLTIDFSVVDASNSEPIESLRIEAGFVESIQMFGMPMPMPSTSKRAQTEYPGGVVVVDGFEVRAEDSPKVALHVHADGYRSFMDDDIEVSPSGRVDLGVLRLQPAVTVLVRVLDAQTGQPVAGATVSLEPVEAEAGVAAGAQAAGSQQGSISLSRTVDTPGMGMRIGGAAEAAQEAMSGETDEDGLCRITAQFEGPGRVLVESVGYAAWRQPAGELNLPLVATNADALEVQASLVEGGRVLVRVLDGRGDPVPGARVSRFFLDEDAIQASADEQGLAVFKHLVPGEHRFRALDLVPSADPMFEVRAQFEGVRLGRSGEPVVVQSGIEHELTLRQPLRGVLAGAITLDGQPLEGAAIRLVRAGEDIDPEAAKRDMAMDLAASMFGSMLPSGDGERGETDGLGEFAIERAAVGDYQLRVQHSSLAMAASVPVVIVEGDNRVDLALRSTVVRGRVVDASGVGIARAKVSALRATPGFAELSANMGEAQEVLGALMGGASVGQAATVVRTDSDGAFELSGICHGVPFVVQASARMHIEGSVPVEAVAEGSIREGVQLVLDPAGRVTISARNVEGALGVKLEWVEGAASSAGSGPDTSSAPRTRQALLKRSRATVSGLRPGTWRVQLDGLGMAEGVTEPQTVQVEAGKTARVSFGG